MPESSSAAFLTLGVSPTLALPILPLPGSETPLSVTADALSSLLTIEGLVGVNTILTPFPSLSRRSVATIAAAPSIQPSPKLSPLTKPISVFVPSDASITAKVSSDVSRGSAHSSASSPSTSKSSLSCESATFESPELPPLANVVPDVSRLCLSPQSTTLPLSVLSNESPRPRPRSAISVSDRAHPSAPYLLTNSPRISTVLEVRFLIVESVDTSVQELSDSPWGLGPNSAVLLDHTKVIAGVSEFQVVPFTVKVPLPENTFDRESGAFNIDVFRKGCPQTYRDEYSGIKWTLEVTWKSDQGDIIAVTSRNLKVIHQLDKAAQPVQPVVPPHPSRLSLPPPPVPQPLIPIKTFKGVSEDSKVRYVVQVPEYVTTRLRSFTVDIHLVMMDDAYQRKPRFNKVQVELIQNRRYQASLEIARKTLTISTQTNKLKLQRQTTFGERYEVSTHNTFNQSFTSNITADVSSTLIHIGHALRIRAFYEKNVARLATDVLASSFSVVSTTSMSLLGFGQGSGSGHAGSHGKGPNLTGFLSAIHGDWTEFDVPLVVFD
ncbi:uncharacterized protein BJ171DRAFT_515959 [Polychytrium aggregatum]|uniref:uncharacterized protein n=1 Tax=Polychytrium aggregatum TaxID=110093 RepID=UPI0022FE79BA|nr:uncharacterized protein BJ171DRAFT_515959 [Polychytrium aggregatum]KAI9201926.1 hypothetical protein BJ171DRAFT_515959 [Polychytrium aggregatum]